MAHSQLVLIGTSYQLETVEQRECLRFSPEEQSSFIARLISSPFISEAGLLSTCNRTECYLVTDDPEAALLHLRTVLKEIRCPAGEKALFGGYKKQNEDAARHLFRVAAGLESQLLGENQILGQVKDSYERAVAAKGAGPILHRLFNLALQVGKRVRSETNITKGVVSSGSAAADLLIDSFGETFQRRRVLIIGAGKMAEMAAQQLKKRSNGRMKISVASRKLCHAYRMARELDCKFFPIQDLPLMIGRADALIAAVSTGEYVVQPEHFAELNAEAEADPFVCVDIGVPRNIDPAVRDLPSVALHDIDALDGVVTQTMQARRNEIPAAEELIEESLEEFKTWFAGRRAAPIIEGLQRYVERLCQNELERYGHTFRPEDEEKLARFSRSLAKKIIREPIHQLREAANRGDDLNLDALHEFFNFALKENESPLRPQRHEQVEIGNSSVLDGRSRIHMEAEHNV